MTDNPTKPILMVHHIVVTARYHRPIAVLETLMPLLKPHRQAEEVHPAHLPPEIVHRILECLLASPDESTYSNTGTLDDTVSGTNIDAYKRALIIQPNHQSDHDEEREREGGPRALCAACLVDTTWYAIASPLLYRHVRVTAFNASLVFSGMYASVGYTASSAPESSKCLGGEKAYAPTNPMMYPGLRSFDHTRTLHIAFLPKIEMSKDADVHMDTSRLQRLPLKELIIDYEALWQLASILSQHSPPSPSNQQPSSSTLTLLDIFPLIGHLAPRSIVLDLPTSVRAARLGSRGWSCCAIPAACRVHSMARRIPDVSAVCSTIIALTRPISIVIGGITNESIPLPDYLLCNTSITITFAACLCANEAFEDEYCPNHISPDSRSRQIVNLANQLNSATLSHDRPGGDARSLVARACDNDGIEIWRENGMTDGSHAQSTNDAWEAWRPGDGYSLADGQPGPLIRCIGVSRVGWTKEKDVASVILANVAKMLSRG